MNVRERPEILEWSAPRGRDRPRVGCLVWLLLCVIASLPGVSFARQGKATPSRPPRLEAQAAEPRLVIDWRDGRLSINARASPWEDVLPALTRHTDITIRVHSTLTGTLTQAFEALPLDEGLRRLFRGLNTVFIYAPRPHAGATTALLTEVWLSSMDSGAVARSLLSAMGSAASAPHGAADAQQDSAMRRPPEEEPPPAGEEAEAEEPVTAEEGGTTDEAEAEEALEERR
jgi:hypothetical protein